MEIDEAIRITQDRLAEEGGSMEDLLVHFRSRISPILIGETEWERVLECAGKLPITMGSLPFGFELPLHTLRPEADFGVSMASGTRAAEYFLERARTDRSDETAGAIARICGEMEAEDSLLREIVGRKLMLEYDIGTAQGVDGSFPGLFLRPGERPIVGTSGQTEDVSRVIDALASSVGWEWKEGERKNVERAYLAQPEGVRLDSFGVFPSRSRFVRLTVMGFRSRQEVCRYLEETDWSGEVSTVDSVIARFRERVPVIRTGLNLDVQEGGIGPTLGLTFVVRQRYTEDARYWLDGLTDWEPFLNALSHEEIVFPQKLDALLGWISKPSVLFAKSGRFVLLRGIHHVKLVISENQLQKAKAYVFMVLSGATSQ